MGPLELFKESVNRSVCVHVSDRGTYTGSLLGFDTYVNTTLKNTVFEDADGNRSGPMKECIVNGQYITFIEIV